MRTPKCLIAAFFLFSLAVFAAESLKTDVFPTTGMKCGGCEAKIQKKLAEQDGIKDVKADHKTKQVTVTYVPSKISASAIKLSLESLGYKVTMPKSKTESK